MEEAHCVCTYLGWDLILPCTQFKLRNEKWTHVSPAGCRYDEPIFNVVIVKCCNGHVRVCTCLHWSEQWASHPQIRIRCCVQRQQLDHWHCCNQAVEMTENHVTQCMSFQLVADVMNRLLKKRNVVIVKCCTGHCRVCTGLHWSERWVLHPQFRNRCCLQRERLDQWRCCSQAVETIDKTSHNAHLAVGIRIRETDGPW